MPWHYGIGLSSYEFWIESRIQSTKVGGLERVKQPSRKNASTLGWWWRHVHFLSLCQLEGSMGLYAWREGALLQAYFCLLEPDEPCGLWCQKTSVPRSCQRYWNVKDRRNTEWIVGVCYSWINYSWCSFAISVVTINSSIIEICISSLKLIIKV